MDELEQLLALLGVNTFAEAATAVTRMNAFLADARERTGQRGTPEALDAVRHGLSFARTVEASLGAQGGEAVARIEALKASGERLKAAEEQLATVVRAQADTEAASLITQATTDGRLEPAKQETAQRLYADHGIGALRMFLDCLPSASAPRQPGAGTPRQPAPRATVPQGQDEDLETLSSEELAVAKAMGKTPKAAIEAKKLWAQSKGQLTEAEFLEMNEAQVRERQKQRQQGLGAF